MGFQLGNHYIDEILYGVSEVNHTIQYTLDQLSDASIEISSDSTDITDKKGNIVRTVYRTKTGTFSATNALLHPAAMNAQSGSGIQYAGDGNAAVVMPKIIVGAAGAVLDIPDADKNTVELIGIYENGANGVSYDNTSSQRYISGSDSNQKITLPDGGEGQPTQYLVKYDRSVTSGAKLTNTTKDFAPICQLTLMCAYAGICDEELRPCYVVIPRFAADPSMTLSLSADETTVDFSGNLNIAYCEGTSALYYIYYPDEKLVVSGTTVTARND